MFVGFFYLHFCYLHCSLKSPALNAKTVTVNNITNKDMPRIAHVLKDPEFVSLMICHSFTSDEPTTSNYTKKVGCVVL